MSRRTVVSLADTPPSGAAPVSTGRAFVAAITNKGIFDPANPCRSMTDVQKRTGTRQTFSTAYDWAENFFREGGAELFFMPARGPAAALATLNIPGTAGTGLVATAKSVGDWANGVTGGYSVQVVNGPINGAGYRQIILFFNAVEVGRSPEYNANANGVCTIDEVDITLGGGTGLTPVMAATNLAAGTLDRTNITQTQIDAAINLPGADLGPGQIAAPDWQTAATHATLRAHGKANNRWALPDSVDTTSKATLLAAGAAEQGAVDGMYSQNVLAPWLTIRGIPGVTSRSVPPSAFVAAKMAQTDLAAGPNQAAAGARYGAQSSPIVTGVKATFSDQDQADLEAAGVSLILSRYGQVFFDGNRSLVKPGGADDKWLQASNCRLRMALVAQLVAGGQQFENITITREHIAQYDTVLTGVMHGFQDQLFPADDGSDPGFLVDTGPDVNTTATIAARQLNAQVGYRPAKGADMVLISLSVVGIGDPIA